jgi:hypothetical protein
VHFQMGVLPKGAKGDERPVAAGGEALLGAAIVAFAPDLLQELRQLGV